ncbi:MAG: type II restriction endonuclease [Verrucomicrobiales bacterium]|nr:type II restriction endonuclease [Verrucomicrobiales bacterium]
MNLSAIFSQVAHKRLVKVDLPKRGSNQHEFNGVSALKTFFGTNKKIQGSLHWHYFGDDQEPAQEDNKFTFYDARAKSNEQTGRSEWRFYYYGSFLARVGVGDWFVLAKAKSGQLFALVFQCNSGWERAAHSLFGVSPSKTSFDSIRQETLDSQRIDLLQRQILAELDLEVTVPVVANDEELILRKFGRTFPTTKIMSDFAREQTPVDYKKPDEALVRWLDREEALFRAMENVIIRERLQKGFTGVDDFIGYSLSVQNRRKSRMGFALQNHLVELFTRQGLRFTPQARTEANNKPDFIFPGQREYHDESFDAALLVMLGVKSTSKDRWRQVLTEADRIPKKHLCTLEAGISVKQTDEMQRQQLTLVVPTGLHATYTPAQLSGMLSVTEFVEFVRRKQS